MQVNLFGDVCLEGINTDRFVMDPRIAELAAAADHNIANLESPLTDAVDGMPYRMHLIKADPRANPIIDLFDVYSLANNHITDYKEQGLNDTVTFLRQQKKHFFGVGTNKNGSFIPLTLDGSGMKLALLGFTRWNCATRTSAGTTPDDGRRLARIVRDLSDYGYFVLLFPHWNYEYVDYPAPSNRRLSKEMIDAGADLIIGAHPHVAQGYERYAGKWIFHSLGNFVFNPARLSRAQTGDKRVRQTFILKVMIRTDKSYEFEIVPVHSDAHGARVLAGDEGAAVLERLAALSAVFHDERLARRCFYDQAVKEIERMSAQMNRMVKQKGGMYILSRLHRARLEDVKIKLLAMSGRHR